MLLTLCIGRSLEYIKKYPKQQRKKEKKCFFNVNVEFNIFHEKLYSGILTYLSSISVYRKHLALTFNI